MDVVARGGHAFFRVAIIGAIATCFAFGALSAPSPAAPLYARKAPYRAFAFPTPSRAPVLGSSPSKPLYVRSVTTPTPAPAPSPVAPLDQRIAQDPAAHVSAQILAFLEQTRPWAFTFLSALLLAVLLSLAMRGWERRADAMATRSQLRAMLNLVGDRLEAMVQGLPTSYVQARNGHSQLDVMPPHDFAADTPEIMTRLAQSDVGRALGSLLEEWYAAVSNAVAALRGYDAARSRAEFGYQTLSVFQRRDFKRGEASEVDARFDAFVTEARAALVVLRELQARVT